MNNYSKQREIILEAIKATNTHPTADQIYKMLIEKDKKISRSTVYRNINILIENKIIKKITMQNGPDRYDYIHKSHNHVICEKCGKIYDFYYNFDTEKISEDLKDQTGIKIQVDSITINGICNDCKSK